MKPRVLYVPMFIAAEAERFAALVEDWAEVASFDVPEQDAVEAAHARLDELAWDDCMLVSDGYAQGLAAEVVMHRPERFRTVAIGHAALRYTAQPPRPALHPDVLEAARRLLETDYMSFWRAVTQITQGAMSDAWVERWAASVPQEQARARFFGIADEEPPAVELLARFDGNLLLAQHVDCVLFTADGFEDAIASFPTAQVVRCNEIPPFDPAFGAALRELAE